MGCCPTVAPWGAAPNPTLRDIEDLQSSDPLLKDLIFSEQIEKGTALWQFLMRKLEDPDCRGWIRWTGNDLEFKVKFVISWSIFGKSLIDAG